MILIRPMAAAVAVVLEVREGVGRRMVAFAVAIGEVIVSEIAVVNVTAVGAAALRGWRVVDLRMIDLGGKRQEVETSMGLIRILSQAPTLILDPTHSHHPTPCLHNPNVFPSFFVR